MHSSAGRCPKAACPSRATSYDAVMVFGGSQHPDQDDRFDWLAARGGVPARRARSRGAGVRGVPRSADARARGRRDGRAGKRAGDRMARRRAHTRGRCRPGPRRPSGPRPTVFQWHHYTFEVPPGGDELARSAICPQAFRLPQPAWGIQFHAEVTQAMVAAWVEEDPDDLPMPAADLRAESEARMDTSNAAGTGARRRVPRRRRVALAATRTPPATTRARSRRSSARDTPRPRAPVPRTRSGYRRGSRRRPRLPRECRRPRAPRSALVHARMRSSGTFTAPGM